MTKRKILFAVLFTHLFSIVLFLKGFFPTKSLVSQSSLDVNGLFDDDVFTGVNASLPEAIVGPTVIMVIDALRADFVLPLPPGAQGPKLMPYLQGLLDSGEAIGHVARAHPPTVTLPRIKALMTGSISGYIDVILNLGSSELMEDNLLNRAVEKGLRIVFYGDDTWIRLFPRHFVRKEGTTSFFVTDYVEVDLNVTRHLDQELRSDDWDVLVLHYLGLDHIGHFAGPRSPLVPPKLLEMDEIVERIFESLRKGGNGNPLLVICGDHGMSDSGSHGGASAAETRVPIILASPMFAGISAYLPEEVLQIDLAPTLALLLGLPIPHGNIGRMIRPAFATLDWRLQLRYAYINAHQLQLVSQQYAIAKSELADVAKRHSLWLENRCFDLIEMKNASCPDPNSILSAYYDLMGKLSQAVSERSTNYDCYAMIVAILLQWLSLFAVFLNCLTIRLVEFRNRQVAIVFLALLAVHFGLCSTAVCSGSCLCQSVPISLFLVFMICFFVSEMLYLAYKSFRNYRKLNLNVAQGKFSCNLLWLGFGLVAQTVSLAASSFVEEEHQIWYFFTATAYLAILYHVCRIDTTGTPVDRIRLVVSARIFLMLALLRLARVWNSTGDKWAHLPDIGDYLNEASNQSILSSAFTLGLTVLVIVRGYQKSALLSTLLALIGCLCIAYRIDTGTLSCSVTRGLNRLFPILRSTLAKLIFALIFLTLPIGLKTGSTFSQAFATVWVFVTALLLRPHNVPLLAIIVVTEKLFSEFVLQAEMSTEITTILTIYMAPCSFFQMGNSNSLASIDLAGGFVGLDSYNPVIVGLLLFCSTYAGPIFWFISLYSTMHHRKTEQR